MTENLACSSSGCTECGLQKVCFPKGLNRIDIELLETIVDNRPSLYRGEYLFKSGDEFSSLFAVKAGLIKVFSSPENEPEVIHGFYLPGEVVGVDALASKKYSFNAVALDVTNVCGINVLQMEELSRLVPNLNMHVLQIMSQEILEGRLHAELLTKKSAEQRVSYFLWSMVERFKERGYNYTEFRLNILHKEMAVFLNLTPETVSRVLAQLCNKKILTWRKKEVFIFSLEGLKNLALAR